MTIEINDKTLELKNTLRAQVYYEQIAGETFGAKTPDLTAFVTLMYSMALAADPGLGMGLMDFIDWLDNQEGLLNKFCAWYVRTTAASLKGATVSAGLTSVEPPAEESASDDPKKKES